MFSEYRSPPSPWAPSALFRLRGEAGPAVSPSRWARASPRPPPEPSRSSGACRGTGPGGEERRAEGSGPVASVLRAAAGLEGAVSSRWGWEGSAHSPHSDAHPGDEQSHASGTRGDAQVLSAPSTGASVRAHPPAVRPLSGRGSAG